MTVGDLDLESEFECVASLIRRISGYRVKVLKNYLACSALWKDARHCTKLNENDESALVFGIVLRDVPIFAQNKRRNIALERAEEQDRLLEFLNEHTSLTTVTINLWG